MKRIYITVLFWFVLTAGYLILRGSFLGRLDQLQAMYFIIGILPSALSYRSASYRCLNQMIIRGQVDLYKFQLRFLGTVSPIFLKKLFLEKFDFLSSTEQRLLKIKLVTALLIFVLSYLVLNWS
jgi:hypothetical protein